MWRHVVKVVRSAGRAQHQVGLVAADRGRPNVGAQPLRALLPRQQLRRHALARRLQLGRRRSPQFGGWRSFQQDLRQALQAQLTRLGPQPIWIAEVGSASDGGNKAKWVRNMWRDRAQDGSGSRRSSGSTRTRRATGRRPPPPQPSAASRPLSATCPSSGSSGRPSLVPGGDAARSASRPRSPRGGTRSRPSPSATPTAAVEEDRRVAADGVGLRGEALELDVAGPGERPASTS